MIHTKYVFHLPVWGICKSTGADDRTRTRRPSLVIIMNNTNLVLIYIDLFNYHVMPICEMSFLDNMVPWMELFKIKSFFPAVKTSTKAICNSVITRFVTPSSSVITHFDIPTLPVVNAIHKSFTSVEASPTIWSCYADFKSYCSFL